VSDTIDNNLYRIRPDQLSHVSFDPMDDVLQADETPTLLPGVLAEDTILTLAGSPYVVSNHLDVPAGITLTIEPGVRILVGRNDAWINVSGRVVARGTAAQPIIFSHTDASIQWGAIAIDHNGRPDAPESVLAFTRIQYAGIGLETRRASPSVESSWIRALPSGKDTGGGFNIDPKPGVATRLAHNAGAAVRLYLGGADGTPPGPIEVLENHVAGVVAYDGYEVPSLAITRNVLEAGVALERTSNTTIIANQAKRPISVGEFASHGNLHENVSVVHNLVESTYQVNGAHGNVQGYEARANTFTNGWGSWDVEPEIDPLVAFEVRDNNIVGGVGEWQAGDNNIRPYASVLQCLPTQTWDLAGNWWGTTDLAAIRWLVWDQYWDASSGVVRYEPIRTAPDPHGFLRGRVFDAVTGLAVPGATVSVGAETTATSVDGYFALTLSSGAADVTFAAAAYEPRVAAEVPIAALTVVVAEVGLWPTGTTPAPRTPPPAVTSPVLSYPPVPPGTAVPEAACTR
jgi:hypothetical protein